jgi:hypothetical protein
VSVAAGNVDSAEVHLKLSNYPTTLSAAAGEGLVSGTLWTSGRPDIDSQVDDGRAEVEIGEAAEGWMLNPLGWVADGETHTWDLALSPDVPIELRLDVGNGSVQADLSDAVLTGLRLEGDNGRTAAILPPGEYALVVDGGNGALELTLPDDGRQQVQIGSGNGSVQLALPQGVEARIEFDEGNGRIAVDGRFEQVRGDDDRGVYQTAGYQDGAGLRVDLASGNGSISVTEP